LKRFLNTANSIGRLDGHLFRQAALPKLRFRFAHTRLSCAKRTFCAEGDLNRSPGALSNRATIAACRALFTGLQRLSRSTIQDDCDAHCVRKP